ncbi:MAG TPA: divalent metal cation transporter, partial [Ilumatobacteraceae bacterium]
MSRQTTRERASIAATAQTQTTSPRDGDGEHGFVSYVRSLGPGLVTGASDDDPSGIATYSQAGAQFKYAMAWVALLTLPLSTAVQEICDRTALATGKTLGELARTKFGRFGRAVMTVLLVALLAANTANIAADLLAIGSGLHLLHLGPVWLGALIAGILISVIVVVGSFELISRIFRYLCLSLFAYIVVLAAAKVEWGAVLRHTFVPHIQFDGAYLG